MVALFSWVPGCETARSHGLPDARGLCLFNDLDSWDVCVWHEKTEGWQSRAGPHEHCAM